MELPCIRRQYPTSPEICRQHPVDLHGRRTDIAAPPSGEPRTQHCWIRVNRYYALCTTGIEKEREEERSGEHGAIILDERARHGSKINKINITLRTGNEL